MKIAIASDGEYCSEHFGHCTGFKVYEIENNKIKKQEFITNPGHKPGYLPSFLSEKGIKVIISSGMGERAQNLFKNNNIKVVVGANGLADELVKLYIDENLQSDESICNKHEFEGQCS